MIRRNVNLAILLFCYILVGCGGQSATRPIEIEDADSYTHDGLQAFSAADWNRAQWLFFRALSIFEAMDDQRGVLYSHINLAEVALSAHHYSVSQEHLKIAANIAKDVAMDSYQARITLLNARIALQQKQYSQAQKLLQSILPEFDRITPVTRPDLMQINAVAVRTKIAFVEKKDEQLWFSRYTKVMELSGVDPKDLNFRLLRFKSDLLRRKEQYAEAESNLQQALVGYKMSHNRSGIAATLLELGQLHMSQKRWQEAKNYLDRSIAVFRHLSDRNKVNQVKEKLAEVELKLGDHKGN